MPLTSFPFLISPIRPLSLPPVPPSPFPYPLIGPFSFPSIPLSPVSHIPYPVSPLSSLPLRLSPISCLFLFTSPIQRIPKIISLLINGVIFHAARLKYRWNSILLKCEVQLKWSTAQMRGTAQMKYRSNARYSSNEVPLGYFKATIEHYTFVKIN